MNKEYIRSAAKQRALEVLGYETFINDEEAVERIIADFTSGVEWLQEVIEELKPTSNID